VSPIEAGDEAQTDILTLKKNSAATGLTAALKGVLSFSGKLRRVQAGKRTRCTRDLINKFVVASLIFLL
jgi:hypothetical protein